MLSATSSLSIITSITYIIKNVKEKPYLSAQSVTLIYLSQLLLAEYFYESVKVGARIHTSKFNSVMRKTINNS